MNQEMLLPVVAGVLLAALGVWGLTLRSELARARKQATENAERYRSLLEGSLAGTALISEDGRMLEWNPRLAGMVGSGRAEVDSPVVLKPAWQDQIAEFSRIARQQDKGVHSEAEFVSVNGETRRVSLRHWPATADGRESWLLVHDVTRRHEARILLRLARRVYECLSEAILVTDVTTRIIDINPAFERITGYSRAEVMGKRASLLRSDRHGASFFEDVWGHLNGDGAWKGEIWNRCRDGRVIPCWMHIDAIRDPEDGEVSHYVGVFSDISERKRIEERISYLAQHDALTGLSNRFSLEAVLPQSISLARRQGLGLAILFIDMDHFKDINDRHGHAVGDQVLIETGRRIARSIRDSDFLARIGGDEFVVVLNDIGSGDDARAVAEVVHKALCVPIAVGDASIRITPSIGISLFPEDGEEADSLMARADDAMYRAKAEGRDSLRFYSAAPLPPPA